MKTTPLSSRAAGLVSAAFTMFFLGAWNAAGDLRITSFHGNGELSWAYENSNAVYRVEWSPSLNGPWVSSWDELGFIPSLGSTSFTVGVPMFYRVVADTNSGFDQNIFVSASTGTDVASAGGLLNPCRTIQYGIQRAGQTGKTRVNISAGTYREALALRSGVSLFGGYNESFGLRNPAASPSILQPTNPVPATIVASNITAATVLDGFFIYAPTAPSSPNNIALYLLNCSADFVVSSNTIFGGSAADGADGAHGTDGASGSNGADGALPTQIIYNSPGSNPGGAGGSGNCQSVNVSGGAGGSAFNPVFDSPQSAGVDGLGISGLGGSGGAGGFDARFTNYGSCVLLVPSGSRDGGHGSNGQAGVDGPGGPGAATPGSLSGASWLPSIAAPGTAGQPGGGGGGGGAGGGSIGISTCNFTYDNRGPSGGGGGAGGCGGTPGGGGASGGSSFGVFVFSSSPSSVPVLQSNTIYLGKAGNGGRGGTGGRAGVGGQGGMAQNHSIFGPGFAGNGGRGGDGGHGGGGGGGAGGLSAGIFANFSNGDYTNANTILTATGSSGKAGPGGLSLGRSGTSGVPGAVHTFLAY